VDARGVDLADPGAAAVAGVGAGVAALDAVVLDDDWNEARPLRVEPVSEGPSSRRCS
jgi:hypothetical protein